MLAEPAPADAVALRSGDAPVGAQGELVFAERLSPTRQRIPGSGSRPAVGGGALFSGASFGRGSKCAL